MKTLIELYDDRPIENVLATEVFRPKRTVFLCSASDARSEKVKKTLADYFRHCGLCPELVFRETAMYGILPVFISCKTCAVTTEALNELAILRARFGGKGAKAAIVTSQNCGSITRHRAQELGIDVIDLDDLKKGRIREHLLSLVRTE